MKSEIQLSTSDVPVISTVASSATNVVLFAARKGRKQVIIQNTSSAILYVSLGTTAATATTGHSIQMAANTYIVLDRYSGAATGIWASANGQANITEFL